jgi:hypothetical protein
VLDFTNQREHLRLVVFAHAAQELAPYTQGGRVEGWATCMPGSSLQSRTRSSKPNLTSRFDQ